ncbi:hypothetical protein Abr02nite_53150 [Paractinoplanes brasiliensis]|nr:hypothetical protein Abr02nite_53150 [Actinoplanes brasiliensis]
MNKIVSNPCSAVSSDPVPPRRLKPVWGEKLLVTSAADDACEWSRTQVYNGRSMPNEPPVAADPAQRLGVGRASCVPASSGSDRTEWSRSPRTEEPG